VADAVIAHRPNGSSTFPLRKLKNPSNLPKANTIRALVGKSESGLSQSGTKGQLAGFFTHLKITYARRPSLQKELAKS